MQVFDTKHVVLRLCAHNARKRVTLYSTAPWIGELGTMIDPMERPCIYMAHLYCVCVRVCLVINAWLCINMPGFLKKRRNKTKLRCWNPISNATLKTKKSIWKYHAMQWCDASTKPYPFPQSVSSLIRERLRRVRSHLKLEIVKKYLDKRGQQRVVPW